MFAKRVRHRCFLGMTRADLRYIAMIEGSIAALIGCALGSIL